jgi:GntR family transcriptional regulator, transcriptional repressor for pyruvate dehydrogenase complex
MDQRFEFTISRVKLPEQVADRIQALIVADALHAGDKLPAERELAERLGVSRPVIREALQVLSVRGLAQIKPGCGTYVQEPSAQGTAAHLELYFQLKHCPNALRDFFEVRQLLEVESAGLAAERATPGDLAVLQNSIYKMAEHLDSLVEFIQADLDFHMLLASAAHNDYIHLLLGSISGLWSQAISLSAGAPGALPAGLAHHREIMQCVARGDAPGAREAMTSHMCAAREFIKATNQTDEFGPKSIANTGGVL